MSYETIKMNLTKAATLIEASRYEEAQELILVCVDGGITLKDIEEHIHPYTWSQQLAWARTN